MEFESQIKFLHLIFLNKRGLDLDRIKFYDFNDSDRELLRVKANEPIRIYGGLNNRPIEVKFK